MTPEIIKTASAATLTALTLNVGAATAQDGPADGEMLLAAFENCMTWADRGFPDATPFDSGFIVETPFTPGGTGRYAVSDTGMKIELIRNDATIACRVNGAGAAASPDIEEELQNRFETRAEAGRAHRVRQATWALCDDPRGVAEVTDLMAGATGFSMRWSTGGMMGMERACDD